MSEPPEHKCRHCGATLGSAQKRAGHEQWCEKNPNRREGRTGRKRARGPAAPAATVDPLPEHPPDPAGSTRDGTGRLHLADDRADRLALADASVEDIEAALRGKYLRERLVLDAKLRTLRVPVPRATFREFADAVAAELAGVLGIEGES